MTQRRRRIALGFMVVGAWSQLLTLLSHKASLLRVPSAGSPFSPPVPFPPIPLGSPWAAPVEKLQARVCHRLPHGGLLPGRPGCWPSEPSPSPGAPGAAAGPA